MWKLCATLTSLLSLVWATVQAGQTNLFSEYNITPGNQVGYYHYPAPPKSQQFHDSSAKTLPSVFIPTIAPSSTQQLQRSVQGAAQAYQNQYQYHGNTQPQQYASNYRSVTAITKQFSSPALDNAAFNWALTNQGYTLGGNNAGATSRASKTAIAAASTKSAAPLSSDTPASLPPLTSLNVKLPLPLGITPLNIAPLPLQAGAPYTSIPNSVTSYGTTYPQRKRR